MLNFEKSFLLKLIEKDSDAYNKFYLQSVDMFFRYAKSTYFLTDEEVQDLMSDFYLKVWKSISKFDIKQTFSNWVWTVYKNTIKDYFKKKKELSFSTINSGEEGTSFEEDLEDDFDLKNLFNVDFEFEKIKEAMQNLDEISQQLIYLKYIEEQSNDEISDLLGISNDNVRQKLFRSLKKLKKLLNY